MSPALSTDAWMVIGVIAAMATVGVLHLFALRLEHEARVRSLSVEAERLRRGYAERLARLRESEMIEPIEVEEVPEVEEVEPEQREAA